MKLKIEYIKNLIILTIFNISFLGYIKAQCNNDNLKANIKTTVYSNKNEKDLELKILFSNKSQNRLTLPYVTPITRKTSKEFYLYAELEFFFSEKKGGKYKRIKFYPYFFEENSKADRSVILNANENKTFYSYYRLRMYISQAIIKCV
ncbi:MAG: hypothetical protein JST02_00965 [Bacteroidetes bacterium]|nr:hypothetical protein [Bacteroidota bacterium]